MDVVGKDVLALEFFSAALIYDLLCIHFIFFTFYGYITNSQNDQLPVALITMLLVEHCTDIAVAIGSPIKPDFILKLCI